MLEGNKVHPRERSFSEQVEEKRKQLFFVIITVIVFAFLVNVLANVFADIIFARMKVSVEGAYIIGSIGLLTFAMTFILFKLLEPPTVIEKRAHCTILYNIKESEILHFPSDYWPQGLAHQAFESLLGKKEEYRDGLKENLAERSHRYFVEKRWKDRDKLGEYKHLFSHFLEYLIIYWLRSDFGWIMISDTTSERELKFEHFPANLRNNVFLSFFNDIKPKDLFEAGLCQALALRLPEDFKLNYIFPQPIPNRVPEPNSGEVKLVGKYCKMSISFFNTSWGRATSARVGPSPISASIMGTPINPFFQDYLSRHLAEICQVDYALRLRVKFSSLKLLWSSKARSYAKLIEKASEDFQNFFDIEMYAKRTMKRAREDALEKIFELLEELKFAVKRER